MNSKVATTHKVSSAGYTHCGINLKTGHGGSRGGDARKASANWSEVTCSRCLKGHQTPVNPV